MIVRIIVLLFIAVILFSLGSALYYLVKDKGQSERTVKALTVRITFSIVLFLILMLGFYFGLISPQGL
ncbi:MAG: twin transmembrane helix small protein [Burkholderiales bacterium]